MPDKKIIVSKEKKCNLSQNIMNDVKQAVAASIMSRNIIKMRRHHRVHKYENNKQVLLNIGSVGWHKNANRHSWTRYNNIMSEQEVAPTQRWTISVRVPPSTNFMQNSINGTDHLSAMHHHAA